MKFTLFLILLIACVTSTQVSASEGWYFGLTIGESPLVPIGPYPNRADCADMAGSGLYSHPWRCHLGYPQCEITGNGFFYPKDYSYPVPDDAPIQFTNCFRADSATTPHQNWGWYFLFYTPTKVSIQRCRNYDEYAALADTVTGDEIANYSDMRCPGAPCFSVGFDTACE